MVGLRKTGAVSRMKSIQNWPGISSTSGFGPSRIRRSSKPFASSVPANDSSTMNTTRWPRARRTWPIPTQLFVGPNAPSGKKTIVRAALIDRLSGGLDQIAPSSRIGRPGHDDALDDPRRDRYSATDTIAVSRIAANTRSVRKLFCDSFIQMPRPSVAPTYSPKIAPMTA